MRNDGSPLGTVGIRCGTELTYRPARNACESRCATLVALIHTVSHCTTTPLDGSTMI